MSQFSFLLAVLICATVLCASAETAADFEAQGIAALALSQKDADAIVSAAISFGRASANYQRGGDESKSVEMNSYLYWCKKKMTSAVNCTNKVSVIPLSAAIASLTSGGSGSRSSHGMSRRAVDGPRYGSPVTDAAAASPRCDEDLWFAASHLPWEGRLSVSAVSSCC